MQSRRFVLVGTRVQEAEVPTLLALARRAGLDVRAAAEVPPRPGSATLEGEPDWHTLHDPGADPGLGGLVTTWLTRAVRGAASSLSRTLAADTWLATQVAGGAEILLVALDDTAAQALSRWRSDQETSGAQVWTDAAPRVLTRDQGLDALAEEIAAAGPDLPPRPATAPPDDRAPGARHAVTVLTGPASASPERTLAALDLPRTTVRTVDPQSEPRPDLSGADVVVLDGLGPALALLPQLPASTRVVHLTQVTDRRSPWRHLVPLLAAGPLTATDLDGLLVAAVGPETAALLPPGSGPNTDALPALVDELLAPFEDPGGLDPPKPLLRELAYLTRVNGALTAERRVLERWRTTSDQARRPTTLAAGLERIAATLTETEPGRLPDPGPGAMAGGPEPVPGRVLHLLKVTLPQRQAGYSVRGHQTLRALAAGGVDVVALAVPEVVADPALVRQEVTEEILDGVRYLLPGPVHAPDRIAGLDAQAAAVLAVVRRERPALLHVHSGGRGYDLGVVGAAVARVTGLPWVYEVRGLFESLWTKDEARAEQGETFARRMAKEAELVSLADGALTLSMTMRADLLARGVAPDHLVLAPNAVDPHLALTPEQAAAAPALARRWGLEGRFVLGYVSNLDHDREQIEDIVAATVALNDLGVPARALIVGEGRRRADLERFAARLGAQDLVVFTGAVPHAEVAAAYSLLDVLVVPRSGERAARLVTPLKPYEAMALGVPVVVSDQPALLEIIGAGEGEGERGWSYPTGDAAALARLLRDLAADPEGRAATAGRAREWVLQERTWPVTARRVADLYEEILARPRLTGPTPGGR